MRLQEFQYEVEYLPGPENVLADHLSRHRDERVAAVASMQLHDGRLTVEDCLCVAGHLGYAAASKALDVITHGGDVLEPEHWLHPQLQALWSTGDADPEDMAKEPCAECGAAEGHAHMVICDTCNRPYHLQCCHPPRSIVPAGKWHCQPL